MLQVELDGISAQDLGLRKPDPAGSHFGHAIFELGNVPSDSRLLLGLAPTDGSLSYHRSQVRPVSQVTLRTSLAWSAPCEREKAWPWRGEPAAVASRASPLQHPPL